MKSFAPTMAMTRGAACLPQREAARYASAWIAQRLGGAERATSAGRAHLALITVINPNAVVRPQGRVAVAGLTFDGGHPGPRSWSPPV